MKLSAYVEKHKSQLQEVANAVRCLGMDAVLKAKSGHVGVALGCAELGSLLFFAVMRYHAKNPKWHNRDRFVLSNGHGSILQYALLHLSGYDVSLEDLKNFRQLGSKTPGHPESHATPGVECTTGPLGQGLASAVGMAMAERMLEARFNTSEHALFDHNTYVIAGDGCMMEGVTGEACSLAGHLKLNKLVVFYDDNSITIDGKTDLAFSENVAKRYEAFGWNVLKAEMNDFHSLAVATEQALENAAKGPGETGPTLIVCKGVAGKGSPKWEGNPKIHGNPMSADDVIAAKQHLGITDTTPFSVAPSALEACCTLLARTNEIEKTWNQKVETALRDWQSSAPSTLQLWKSLMCRENVSQDVSDDVWDGLKHPLATRTVTGPVLKNIGQKDPALVGGAADLVGSTLAKIEGEKYLSATDFSGRNIHFGVREHAMGAICNGIALHGVFRPFCSTFTVFADYMRPSIRLAALQDLPVIYVFTHDSIGVGEDGPTHQPVEQIASLRSMPNVQAYRPADGYESVAAWELCLKEQKKPSILFLTRQNVSEVTPKSMSASSHERRNKLLPSVARGAYAIKDFSNNGGRQVILMSSGSEVELALKTAAILESRPFHRLDSKQSISLNIRVLSCPAPQEFARKPAYLNAVLPKGIPAFAVEAGVPQGWGELVGREGAFLGMSTFGASAPAEKVFHFMGFTPEALSERILSNLQLTL